MKKIHIVDLHHEVLPHWAALRRELDTAPEVLCLDFHTDVIRCRREGIEPHPKAYLDDGLLKHAVTELHHDEHFDWALRSDIISKAVIISLAECAVPPEHPFLEVRRNELLPGMDKMLNAPEEFFPVAERVLSDGFLRELLSDGFPHKKYILDIDCDYILCRAALEHPEQAAFRKLIGNAQMVTISKESDWVKILQLKGENITGDFIAETLEKMVKAY